MAQSWLNLAGTRFVDAVKQIIASSSESLMSDSLGEEDTQCQHLFTSIFTNLQAREEVLSEYLASDSEIADLVIVLRYYRSKRKRRRREERIQFVESETGADFALSLKVSLPGLAKMDRHTLAQVKLIESGKVRIDREQLQSIEKAAGGELGIYSVWGEGALPFVLTISNFKAVVRVTEGQRVRAAALKKFSRDLADYMVDDFLGLWHGADFYSDEYEETPPPTSPPALFHFLHRGAPPPNIFHMDITNSRLTSQLGTPGMPPGFFIAGIDSDTGKPFE